MDVDGHQAVWNRRRGDRRRGRRSGVSDRGKQGGQTPIVVVDDIKVSRGGKSGSRMGDREGSKRGEGGLGHVLYRVPAPDPAH